MIGSQSEFEAALEDAITLMDGRSVLNSADKARLRDLLERIKDDHAHLQIPAEHPLRQRLDALTRRLDAFQKQWAAEHPDPGEHWLGTPGFLFPG